MMFRRQSHSESSDNDRTFNFNYELDISGRKGRTGETFNKDQAYDFDDFKDFREDRTQKSEIASQKKWLPSELMKKSDEDSFVGTENITDMSIKRKGGSFVLDDLPVIEESDQTMKTNFKYASPKFNEISKSYRTISDNFYQQKLAEQSSPTSNISRKRLEKSQTSVLTKNGPSDLKILSKPPSVSLSPKAKIRGLDRKLTPEQQFQDFQAQIQYYTLENDQLDYETMKIMQQIAAYENLLANNTHTQIELQKYTDQTNSLNTQISEQKSIQRTLTEQREQLEIQFDQLSHAVEAMKFERPRIIRDEAQAIIEEINSLKSEFENLRRDEGSLNLSSTLQNPAMISVENQLNFNSFKNTATPEDLIFKQYVKQINAIDKTIPNYLFNIKMMAMRDEWQMFENAQICLNCSTRDYPYLQIKIGNKSVHNLQAFCLKQDASIIAQNETLFSKSYYCHTRILSKMAQPFMKIEISYQMSSSQADRPQQSPFSTSSSSSNQKQFAFYLPVFVMKHGEFIPLTKKQYRAEEQQHKSIFEEVRSVERPLDSEIIKSDIKEFLMYYPNLIYENRTHSDGEPGPIGTCKGVFKLWNSNEGALVKISQKNQLVAITVKNNIPFLLKALEFLLTTGV